MLFYENVINDGRNAYDVVSRGLDNKCSVHRMSYDEQTAKKHTVAMHTSFLSCCIFTHSDQQVKIESIIFRSSSGS